MNYRSWLITVGLFLALILSLQLMSAQSNVMAASQSEAELLQGENLALNQPVMSSSNESDGHLAVNAVDGDPGTRWASAFNDPEWIYVDLGQSMEINRVLLNWEASYSTEYELQVSDDATTWTMIYSETASDGGIDDITGLNAMGRYVRMYGMARSLPYGHSLWEFEVYGAAETAPFFDDFEDGIPDGLVTYSDANDGSGSTTSLSMMTITMDLPVIPEMEDNTVLSVTYDIATSGSWGGGPGYGGISRPFSETLDWTGYEGFSFWFHGENTGLTFQAEIFDNGPDEPGSERFDYEFVDDFAGWKEVCIPFTDFTRATDYQPPGAPDDGFTQTEMWGYALVLAPGAGDLKIDNVTVSDCSNLILADFESGVPSGVSIFSDANDGSGSDTTLSIATAAMDLPLIPDVANNDALSVTYDIATSGSWGGGPGYGGVNHEFASTEDWSAYEGFSLWWYGGNSGLTFQVELSDNGPDSANAERFDYEFVEDFTGWHLFEIPFSHFSRATDFQPGDAPDDGFTLTEMWGYAIVLAPGSGSFMMDETSLYGTSGVLPEVGFAEMIYSVEEGDSATITVTLSATAADDVMVDYATSADTATAGDDYTEITGTVTFSPGETTQSFTVATIDDGDAERNEHVMLALSNATNANLGGLTEADLIINDDEGFPYQDDSLPVEDRVNDLLGRMTLDEKIGQMTQVESGSLGDGLQIRDNMLGSVLSGGGGAPATGNTPEDWANRYDEYQELALSTPLAIPLIYGVDAVHGHSNVNETTIFPHNIGLGATRNPALIEQIGHITAIETRATGIPWNFAPCICVARDERWGRTYESFGEDPEIAIMMTSIITGYQGADLSASDSLLATAKHYVGDGGTTNGTDQGNTELTEEELRAIHLSPFEAAIEANVGSIMPSYSSWNGEKLHGHSYLINDVLKGELGFDGFIISDWAGIDQIPGDYNSDVRTSINAGLDMIMTPYNGPLFIDTLRDEVNAGNVSMERIDDAVSRILTKKFELGLFEAPYADRSNMDDIGSQAHRDVARQAVRESLVLLKNADNLLPLEKDTPNILVAGSNADNIGHQSGGWTITWQGGSGDTTDGTTILQGISDIVDAGSNVAHITYPDAGDVNGYDLGIVVVGEPPYAEGVGDDPDLQLNSLDVDAINQVCGAMPCVVVLVSGRPMIINDELDASDAFVAAWLPGTEGDGIAEVLFGDYDFTGKLPMSWPRSVDQLPINVGDADYDPLFEYGYGLVHDATDAPLTVSFARSNYPVEEGEAMTITARLNKVFTDTVTVIYSTADGTATDGEDYTAASGTLTFPAGTTLQSFIVETADDNVEEDNETINLTLSSPTNADLGDRDEAMITIEDNDGYDSIDFPEREIINDYENGVPAEYVTWGNNDNNVTLDTTIVLSGSLRAGAPSPVPGQGMSNSILQANYEIPAGGWGGFTNDYEVNGGTSHDWTAYEGISFWLYGNNTGAVVRVEILDNRNPDLPGDTAERFIYDGLVDDYTGWQFFSIPFTEFPRRTDWQPAGAPDDGFGLTEVWGYAFTFPSNVGPQVAYLDDFALNLRTPIIDDFESGITGEHFTYGEGTVTTIAMDVGPGNPLAFPSQIATNSILSVTYDIGAFGGLGRDFEQTQNWSLRAGFGFWFYGMNSGNTIQVEIFDNGPDSDNAERFDYEFDDNFEGWRHINIPFEWFTRATDYQPGGAPDDGLTLTAMWGYAIVLEPNTSGAFYMDQVELVKGYDILNDFESGVPDYFVTWGNLEDNVTLTTTEVMTDSPLALPFQDGVNSILQANYDIPGGGWGGFTSDYTVDGQRDWTAYDGFSFWLYGNNTGDVVRVEIQDNLNPNIPGDTAERFVYDEIIDDYTGWKFVSVPFSAFQRRSDWQPGGALDDGFGLNEVSGYAITFPPNVGPQVAYMDDVQLFGPVQQDIPQELSVGFDSSEYMASEGEMLTVTVALNMMAEETVSIDYATEAGSARADRDYMSTSGTLVFDADTMLQSFTIEILDDPKYEGEEHLSVMLSDPISVTLGSRDQAVIVIEANDAPDPFIDDFENGLDMLYTSGNITVTTTEIMTGTPMALPGQWIYENVLTVDYDTSTHSGIDPGFGRDFSIAEEWSAYDGMAFWYYGTNSGETMTLKIKDNRLPEPPSSEWDLVWSDEFNGAAGTAPDAANWTAEIGDGVAAGNPGWGNGELEYYTDSTDNAAMDGAGHLVITAQEVDTNTTTMDCYYGPCEYTSARLISENKVEVAYGRIEARIQVPYSQGIWPAFWMLGDNFREVGWPDGGEIDIMEHIGAEPTMLYGTVHGPGYSGGSGIGGNYEVPTGQLSDEFHTFAIEWEPEVIRWYVDDINYFTVTPDDLPSGSEWVFDHPFFLLLNVAVGGYWPGFPDDTSVFPQTMHVDYVRVYQAGDTAERFEATFTDDFEGWQRVTVPFSAFTRSAEQPDGAPDDGLGLTEMWGYGFELPTGSAGTLHFDQISLEGDVANTAPVATDDDAETDEDMAVEIDVLDNDSDADGDTLTITDVSSPANGSATTDGATVTYTPDENYNGDDSFTYTISDGKGGDAIATVNLTINPVNDAPEATDDEAETDENIAVEIDVLDNDTDIEGDDLTITEVSSPTNGSVTTNGATVTYTPDDGISGSDSFSYTIEDGNGGTATASVSVTINPVNSNNPPTAQDDDAETDMDTAVGIDVLANDSDADGDTLTISAVSSPANGSATTDGATVTYTPEDDFVGIDTFTYNIEDGNGGVDSATVTVTVEEVTSIQLTSFGEQTSRSFGGGLLALLLLLGAGLVLYRQRK